MGGPQEEERSLEGGALIPFPAVPSIKQFWIQQTETGSSSDVVGTAGAVIYPQGTLIELGGRGLHFCQNHPPPTTSRGGGREGESQAWDSYAPSSNKMK